MTNQTVLVTGGTGKTGRRIVARLQAAGATSRAASRSGETRFDWDDTSTHGPALEGADAVYLVPPTLRLDYPPLVERFLDQAEAAGVRHVSYLSAKGVEHAPPEAPLRAVELALEARSGLTHSILRPSGFMQNFSEGFFAPREGAIISPTGQGADSMVDADDIAAVAAATLLHPDQYAGAAYTITGPEALTVAQVAERIGRITGRTVTHVDPPRAAWIEQVVAAGVPAEYAELLGRVLDAIRDGYCEEVTDAVAAVTGRAPRSLDEFLNAPETQAAWA